MIRRLAFTIALELALLHVWHVLAHGSRALLSWLAADEGSADAAVEALKVYAD